MADRPRSAAERQRRYRLRRDMEGARLYHVDVAQTTIITLVECNLLPATVVDSRDLTETALGALIERLAIRERDKE